MIPEIFQWIPFENEHYMGGTCAVIMRLTVEEFELLAVHAAARAFKKAVLDYRDSFQPETFFWRSRPAVLREHEYDTQLEVVKFRCRLAWSKVRSSDGALPRELHVDPHKFAVGGLLYP